MVGRIRPLAAFASVVAFLCVAQVLTLVLGVVGVSLGRGLAILIVTLAAVSAAWFSTRFHDPDVRASGRQHGLVTRLLGGLGVGVCLWWLAVWIDLWVLAYLRPTYDWDGLYYHIPAMHAWALEGGVGWIESVPDVLFINYPMGVEANTFLMHHILGTSRLVDACNLWYWPLGFMGLAVVAEQLGAKGTWRWVAGGLMVGASVLVSLSVTSYIDPGFAAAVIAAIASACIVVFRTRGPGWYETVLLGMTVGLALGAKGTGAPFAVVILTLTVVAAIAVRGAARWKALLARSAVAALIALAVGGGWYARALAKTGNPFFPIGVTFGEKVLISGYDPTIMEGWNLPEWLEAYPPGARMFVSWLQLDAPIFGYGTIGGMGYVWIFGCLPAFVYLWVVVLRQRDGSRIRKLAFLTTLVLALLAMQPAPWWARLTLWLHALGLPCVAVVLGDAAERCRSERRHLITVALMIAVLGVAVWESHRTVRIEWQESRLPGATESRKVFLSDLEYRFPGMEDLPGFDEFFEARAIARPPWETRIGPLLGGILSLPLGRREIEVVSREITGPDIQRLRASGIEWLVWDELVETHLPDALSRQAVDAAVFRHPSEGVIRLIRLLPDPP